MATTITICSLSGGQGKTTTVFYLGLFLAKKQKILICDLDPQANLTFFLGYDVQPTDPSAYELLTGESLVKDCIYWSHKNHNVHLIPSDNGLAKAQEYLAASGMSALILKSRLAPLQSDFDFILIDSPPARTQLALTAIGAADYLLIPVETHAKGINSLLRTLELVDGLNALQPQEKIKVLGIVPFRDKWIGRNQQQQSKDAIAAIREIAIERKVLVFPSILESERYKQGIDKGILLDELGYPDLLHPFQNMEIALCQTQQ
jgi:chromosome partitioning protein